MREQMSTATRPTGGDFVDCALGTIRARDGVAAAVRAATEMLTAAAGIIAIECGHEHLHEILEMAKECAHIVLSELQDVGGSA
jgi:hypothetical protein